MESFLRRIGESGSWHWFANALANLEVVFESAAGTELEVVDIVAVVVGAKDIVVAGHGVEDWPDLIWIISIPDEPHLVGIHLIGQAGDFLPALTLSGGCSIVLIPITGAPSGALISEAVHIRQDGLWANSVTDAASNLEAGPSSSGFFKIGMKSKLSQIINDISYIFGTFSDKTRLKFWGLFWFEVGWHISEFIHDSIIIGPLLVCFIGIACGRKLEDLVEVAVEIVTRFA